MTEQKYPAEFIEAVASRIEGSALMGESFEQQAVAALDTLGLTANWGTQIRDDAGEVVDRDDYGEDESEARRQSDRYDEPLVSRWCTQWEEVRDAE